MELDFKKTLFMLLSHIREIIAAIILGGVLFWAVSAYYITPVYTSNALLHVSGTAERKTTSVTSNELYVSRELLDTCVVILDSRTVLSKVIKESGLDYTIGQLRNMIRAESVSSTEIFRISITNPNPRDAAILVDTITKVAPGEIERVISGGKVTLIDSATLPKTPSSPNIPKNTILGALIGAILSISILIINEFMDGRVRDELELEEAFGGIPIIGIIPSFELLEAVTKDKSKKSHHHKKKARAK